MPKIPLWQVPNAPKIPEGTLIPLIPPSKGSKPYKIKPLQRGFLAPNAFTGPGGALAKVGESVVEAARKALPEVKAYDKAFAVPALAGCEGEWKERLVRLDGQRADRGES